MRRLLQALLLGLVVVLLTEALYRVELLERVDHSLQDYWHVWKGKRGDAESEVLLVRVDDESLQRLPNPFVFWGPHFGQAIGTLEQHGATAVGLDFLVKVSGETFFRDNGFGELEASRGWDSSLRAQLFQDHSVLVATMERRADGSRFIDLPLGEYRALIRDPRARLALDNLPLDSDNVVRRCWPLVIPSQEGPGLSLALALVLRHLGLPADAPSWEVAGRRIAADESVLPISYAGPPGTLLSIPFWKLVEEGALGDEERALIRGRLAIIGSAYTNAPDVLHTPYDRMASQRPMFGAELHANIAHMLLSGERVWPLGPLHRALLLLCVVFVSTALFFRLSLRPALGTMLAQVLLWPVAGYYLFAGSGLLLPSISAAFAVTLAFGGAYALRFARELRNQRHLREVFGRYVSEDVLQEILSAKEGFRLGGELRSVTVVMSDIRNFTTISEQLSPEEVVEMLNSYFNLACRPILERGGVVDKFIGDAVMAVFGAPVSRDAPATQAVTAALEMAEIAVEFKKWMAGRFPDRDIPEFDIGVGVHTGRVVTGNIGHEKRMDYTAIGDAVNVAARIESSTKTVGCRVLVSREALEAAGSGFETGKEAKLTVKGRKQPVEMIEVLGVDAEGV